VITFYRIITAVFCFFVALPILWLCYAAFMPQDAIVYLDMTEFGFSLNNFVEAHNSGIWQALGISIFVSSVTVAGQLLFGLMAAYAIRQGLPALWPILLALALPSELLMVPLYREFQILNLLDTLWVMIIPFLASPLIIFLLLQAIRRIPQSILDSARLDGASEVRILWQVVAPLLRPEMLAAGILAFAAHWNLVLFPKVMVANEDFRTVQIFLNDLVANQPLDWGVLAAASLIATLPLIILYLVFENRIITVFETSFKG